MEIQTEIEKDTPNVPAAGMANAGMMHLTPEYVDAVGRQVELRARLIQMALKALKPHDIQDFGGKPYIEGEGAERIMSAIGGFKVGPPVFSIERMDPHYFITCQLTVEFHGTTITEIGDCSTCDPFFTGAKGDSGKLANYKSLTGGNEIMAARMLVADAQKKARQNAISRAVTGLLGLRGLSWADLEALGFSRTAAGSNVKFKNGSQGGAVKTVTVEEFSSLPVGAVFNIRGKLISKETKEVAGGKKKTNCKVEIGPGMTTGIQKWGEVDETLVGSPIFCEKVKVGEYNGTKQYMAESIVPDEGTGEEPAK